MNPVDRLAAACVDAAVRRWPAELAGEMAREWHAELAALRADPALGPLGRARRTVAYAVSLACSPAVEAAGEPARTWRDRGNGLGRALAGLAAAAGVALLAAALFDAVHAANHGLDPRVPAGVAIGADLVLLAAAVAVMARLGVAAGRRGWLPVGRAGLGAVPLGLAVYGFLLAGNRVAVMPFMGWMDIVPAVAAWTVLTAVAIGVSRRIGAGGRGRLGMVVAVAGGVVAVAAAGSFGSLHAARALGLGGASSPAWFALALLPGGVVAFGGPVAGTAMAGGCCAAPGWHASDILLGNASAMVGPLLLCSAFVLAATIRPARSAQPAMTPGEPARSRTSVRQDGGVATGVVAGVAVRAVAGVAGGAGIVAWTWLAGSVSPFGTSDAAATRVAALALAVCALVVLLAGHGPVAAPTAVAAGVLFVADHLAVAGRRHGLPVTFTLLAVAAVAGYAAWRLCAELRGPGTTGTAGRRALLAAAVLGAATVPTALTSPTLLRFLLATVGWPLAAGAALAGRDRPARRLAVAVLVAAPLGFILLVPIAAGTALDGPGTTLPIRAALAVVVLAVARFDGSAPRPRHLGGWLLVGAGAVLLTVPVADALRASGDLMAPALARIADNSSVFGFGFLATVGGQLLLAVALGVPAARWCVPTPTGPDPAGPRTVISGAAGAR